MPYPTYSVSQDTVSGKADPKSLHAEIESLSISGFKGVVVDGDSLTTVCDPEPTTEEKTSIDTTISTHAGVDSVVEDFRVSGGSTNVSINIGSDWTIICGAVTAPQTFIHNKNGKCCGRVVGDMKSDGEVLFRVMENDSLELTDGTVALPSTGGSWSPFMVSAPNNTSSGLNRYTAEAKLNGATTAEMRWTTLTLKEKY